MADKKLINVDAATTMSNIYGNNGSKDVQVSLADAASVLAGQLGHGSNNREDLNNLTSTNFYIIYSTNANSPEINDSAGLCHLFVIRISEGNITQFYINRGSGAFYYRNCTSGNWLAWYKVNTSAV